MEIGITIAAVVAMVALGVLLIHRLNEQQEDHMVPHHHTRRLAAFGRNRGQGRDQGRDQMRDRRHGPWSSQPQPHEKPHPMPRPQPGAFEHEPPAEDPEHAERRDLPTEGTGRFRHRRGNARHE
ncbi:MULTISPECIES: hypothetical protein [unclassified Streptomyces]|uniref:hypothetical protein n=1 Tax=unclassified Streptomyces TaxID=2593676 RepID=UPI002DDA9908|nr:MULTISPECIES: hypothetical protein [unclassified Streptomyces]WSA93388.1 hypothetical protein OIE63_18720 [Streptomyces sp. NBC_01795]WSB77757.1 hypothetical protein OHB04_19550 [Streptomyces sp. NBC_01775]WSS42815.1 hypothetical protein OG220_21200 [Streptomyces sp. NBC_01187]